MHRDFCEVGTGVHKLRILYRNYRLYFNHSIFFHTFIFTLFLPEGQSGEAWEPSKKVMLFLPPYKSKVKGKKVQFVLEQAIKAQRGSRGIAPLFL